MTRSRMTLVLACGLVLALLVACGGGAGAESTTSGAAATVAAGPAASAAGESGSAATAVPTAQGHDAAEDHVWDSAGATRISLHGDSIAVEGSGAAVDGTTVTITSAGAYSVSGSLAGGQVIVDTEDKATVTLILNGVDLSSAASAPIYVMKAKTTVIVLADGTENIITDGDSYVLEDPSSDEPNAAIFSKGDLTIDGAGSLVVHGRYNDGIASKDGLIITNGNITVNAVDDGIRGKDYLVVQGGDITVNAGGDGLKADHAEDAARGNVTVEGGTLTVNAGGDAITGQTHVSILGGDLTLAAGGGSRARIPDDLSAKGIKGLARVEISGGTFDIDAADDAIHSNGSIVIHGGSFVIATGDDAIHADATIEVNGGEIRVTECYEGIESAVITIIDGSIYIASSDDALNVAGRSAGSGNMAPARGGRPPDRFAASGNYYLYINGGYIVLEAAGDGIDVNGAIQMTGGVVLVNGPIQNMNSALDYDFSFKITGGFLVAVGSAGMAQAPDTSSTQHSVLLNLNSPLGAGTLIHVRSNTGKEILTFEPTRQYQSIVFSSAELEQGATYDVYFGGSSTGTATGGLYSEGKYTGTLAGSVTITGVVTQLGARTR